jgi:hypothetical protein
VTTAHLTEALAIAPVCVQNRFSLKVREHEDVPRPAVSRASRLCRSSRSPGNAASGGSGAQTGQLLEMARRHGARSPRSGWHGLCIRVPTSWLELVQFGNHGRASPGASSGLPREWRFRSGAGGARTHDRRIMRSTASCTTHASCTDDTSYHTDGARRAGIIGSAGPRTGPRRKAPCSLIPLLCVTSPRPARLRRPRVLSITPLARVVAMASSCLGLGPADGGVLRKVVAGSPGVRASGR